MSGALLFWGSVSLLLMGYLVYGSFVEKIFRADNLRLTPVQTKADNVDYLPLPNKKIFFIQLLNIAGLGPVLGPIMGAIYGPMALLWVVIGCIFAGAVHDYCAGMISLRYGGASYHEVIGRNLGPHVQFIMQIFAIGFLVLVGAVFVLGPAALLANMTSLDPLFWSCIIFSYYFLATVLPVNVIIGRIYPFFALLLLVMAFGLLGSLLINGYTLLPNADVTVNTNPSGLSAWPLIFITIACGAISGFHATQSPMMARCIKDEKSGRPMFYGAMIAEGILALIWVTLGLSFYDSPQSLQEVINNGTATLVVKEISVALLGPIGGMMAILGVIVLPISTGDTAFRGARLMVAEIFNMDQKPIVNRLLVALPLFAGGIGLTLIDFSLIWRYFGWANQTMASVTLWAIAVYLIRRNRFHWVASLPATFMSVVCITFLFSNPVGFGLDLTISTWLGIAGGTVILVAFLLMGKKMPDNISAQELTH